MFGRCEQQGSLLLCGIQELVLAAAPVAGPDAGVGPKVSDGVYVTPIQLGDLHRVHILDPLSIHLRAEGHTHRLVVTYCTNKNLDLLFESPWLHCDAQRFDRTTTHIGRRGRRRLARDPVLTSFSLLE